MRIGEGLGKFGKAFQTILLFGLIQIHIVTKIAKK